MDAVKKLKDAKTAIAVAEKSQIASVQATLKAPENRLDELLHQKAEEEEAVTYKLKLAASVQRKEYQQSYWAMMKILASLTAGDFPQRLAKLLGQRIHAVASRAEPDEARLRLAPDDFLVERPLESVFDHARLAR